MILAGIVLYNPNIERLKENVNGVINQVDKLIFIDNGSKNIKLVKKEFSEVEIIENEENLGISKALSQLMDYAINNKFDWVLSLDQDSIITNNLVLKYKKFFKMKKLGMLTCKIVDRNFNEKMGNFKNKDYTEVSKCITSASMISTHAYSNIDGYDVKMFIDMVDFDICAQLIEKGYKIIRINYNGVLHEVGEGRNVKFLWMKWISFNHSAFREYYISRNRFYLCKKHPKQYHFFEELLKEIKTWIIILFYEDDKKDKLKAKIKGIKDCRKMNISD